MFNNGLLLGVIGVACAQHGMALDLWSFVAPHGSLELPSIILAGAAGLRLGRGVAFPGLYRWRDSIALAGVEATRMVAGIDSAADHCRHAGRLFLALRSACLAQIHCGRDAVHVAAGVVVPAGGGGGEKDAISARR